MQRVFDLYPKDLRKRVKEERRRVWQKEYNAVIKLMISSLFTYMSIRRLFLYDKYPLRFVNLTFTLKMEFNLQTNLSKAKTDDDVENLKAQIQQLRDIEKDFDDLGPIYYCLGE
jgi:hypothetical protein